MNNSSIKMGKKVLVPWLKMEHSTFFHHFHPKRPESDEIGQTFFYTFLAKPTVISSPKAQRYLQN